MIFSLLYILIPVWYIILHASTQYNCNIFKLITKTVHYLPELNEGTIINNGNILRTMIIYKLRLVNIQTWVMSFVDIINVVNSNLTSYT